MWRDPGSGYLRRNVSPGGFASPIQIVEVTFPAGARVAYENGARDHVVHQQVWVLEGTIELTLGLDTPSTRSRRLPGDAARRADRVPQSHAQAGALRVVLVAEPLTRR